MHSLAGRDPQTFAGLQPGMLQQASAALGAGIGDIRAVRHKSVPGLVADAQLGQIVSIITNDETLLVGHQ
jgi:hypothetical protein